MGQSIVVPELGESVTEGTIVRWLKEEGDAISVGDVLLELETDKVNLEVGAENGGVLTRIDKQAGDDVQVGDVIGEIGEASEAPKKKSKKKSPPKEESAPKDTTKTAGSPSESKPAPKPEPQPEAESAREPFTTPAPTPRIGGAGPRAEREERVRLTRRRQTIAQRLVEAQQNAAMLTTFNEVDMSAVMGLRKRLGEKFQERHGFKLGFISFFIKAVVEGLREFPIFNAYIDGNDLVHRHYYDIGTAVDTGDGLVVPVLREADLKSVAQLERDLKANIEKVREGSLSIADLRGGCFTITNGGIFGSMLSTPILNPPEAGILGLHKIQERPVVVGGEVVIRPMMYVALTYDHRIIDGRTAVQFLVSIKEKIEDPQRLLLEI